MRSVNKFIIRFIWYKGSTNLLGLEASALLVRLVSGVFFSSSSDICCSISSTLSCLILSSSYWTESSFISILIESPFECCTLAQLVSCKSVPSTWSIWLASTDSLSWSSMPLASVILFAGSLTSA